MQRNVIINIAVCSARFTDSSVHARGGGGRFVSEQKELGVGVNQPRGMTFFKKSFGLHGLYKKYISALKFTHGTHCKIHHTTGLKSLISTGNITLTSRALAGLLSTLLCAQLCEYTEEAICGPFNCQQYNYSTEKNIIQPGAEHCAHALRSWGCDKCV